LPRVFSHPERGSPPGPGWFSSLFLMRAHRFFLPSILRCWDSRPERGSPTRSRLVFLHLFLDADRPVFFLPSILRCWDWLPVFPQARVIKNFFFNESSNFDFVNSNNAQKVVFLTKTSVPCMNLSKKKVVHNIKSSH
jgi:hypothetical protein